MLNPLMRTAALALAALLSLPLLVPAPVHGVAVDGACCLANGSCQDLILEQCDTLNGDFIGEGTSCATVDCAAPVAAPLLSIGGLVAALGALAALGVYRLAIRRR
jgi:hypothetical protein